MAGIALLAPPEAKSGSKTSVVEDPLGDAFIFLNLLAGETQRAPDYLDVIRGEVTLQGGFFIFKFTVAGPVPDEPFGPRGMTINWAWLIDTDPATFPPGFPLAPPVTDFNEFDVDILWDGTDFSAIFIDRRPSLVGEDAIVTPIPFNIDGNELSVSVSSRMMDRRRSFEWAGVTALFPGGFAENQSFLVVDILPDGGELAPWPAE
jgi:hypothetical protein